MHLLVLDGSRVLPSLVRRLAPEGVEVESVDTFDDALKRLALVIHFSHQELVTALLYNSEGGIDVSSLRVLPGDVLNVLLWRWSGIK